MKYPLEDEIGGIGLFSTAVDFIKLLRCLIGGGKPIFQRRDSVDTLFSGQLDDALRAAMPHGLGAQTARILGYRDRDDAGQADQTLAGTITLRDVPGRRPKGTVGWSGLPNLHWVSDVRCKIACSSTIHDPVHR